MPERRNESRPEAPDRRSFPRPPLWLNILLLVLGVGGLLYAQHHGKQVSQEFADVIDEQARTPLDVRKMKEELAEMDLTRDALQRELDSRMKFVGSLKSENFYLSVDTRGRKLRFYYGDTVLREAELAIGASRTINANGKTWTFIPLKGAFAIDAKLVNHAWRIPEWVYAMNNQPIPPERPAIPNGLGQYVLFLPDGYAIHTPPGEDSPLKGVKPGSYMVSEDFMRAVWPRINPGKTQVYIY
ncbi:MAG TPA: L,D-transpeptidase [Thermoanaerobaculia bacterium]